MNNFIKISEENRVGDTYINKNKIKIITEKKNVGCEIFLFAEKHTHTISIEDSFEVLKQQLPNFLEVALLDKKKKQVKALINLDNILSLVGGKNGVIFRTRILFFKKIYSGVFSEESLAEIMLKVQAIEERCSNDKIT